MKTRVLTSDALSLSDTVSISEAAVLLGVSERSVYGYLEEGSLAGFRIGKQMRLREEDVRAYRRRPTGRVRINTPSWRQPPANNQLSLTTITVQLRPEQRQRLEQKLLDMRERCEHCFAGTAARYISYDQQHPDEIQILLLWRDTTLSSEREREEALIAFRRDLADVFAWETAVSKDGCVLLHA